MNLQGKRINILGAGRSGRAATALARRDGAEVHVFDQRDQIDDLEAGVTGHTQADASSAESCDMLILSPGVDTYGEFARAFSALAGETLGEVEFGCRHYPGQIIAVTGTNGKTTTIELIEHLLKRAGEHVVACGNYGLPVCEVVMSGNVPDILALEVSSFQLETIVHFRPKVAIWLNFSADHMDRYPDIESYRKAKWRIFENQQATDMAVVRAGESLPRLPGRVIRFSTDDRQADWFSDGSRIFANEDEVIDLPRQSHLPGLHNAENAMAALAGCEALGADRKSLIAGFADYAPPRHRCELVRTLDGVEWLNDSKATNLHALECALRSQTRPVVLIVGGKEKGLDYKPLIPTLKKHAIGVVTFGEIGPVLSALVSPHVTTQSVGTIEQAVTAAASMATSGSTVLMSPGTSSFDQFTGYEERGDTFCKLVLNLN